MVNATGSVIFRVAHSLAVAFTFLRDHFFNPVEQAEIESGHQLDALTLRYKTLWQDRYFVRPEAGMSINLNRHAGS